MRHNGGDREREGCSLLSRSPVNMPPLPICAVSCPLSIIRRYGWRGRAVIAVIYCHSFVELTGWLTDTQPGAARLNCARATLHRAKNSDQSQHTTLPLFHHHHYQRQQQQQPSRGGRWPMCRSVVVYRRREELLRSRRSLSPQFGVLVAVAQLPCNWAAAGLLSLAHCTSAISHIALRKYCQLMLIRSRKVVVVVVVVVVKPSIV